MLSLVTGASGFVGRHLTRHLEEEGDEVVGTDRSDGGPDLLDPDGLDGLFATGEIGSVYHLAGQADVAASWHDPLSTFRVNAEGTLNLLESCVRHGVDRVLVVTSAEVYGLVGADDLPLREDRPLAPHSPYAASKAAVEMLSTYYTNVGLDVRTARAFNHFGPGQSERFVAAALAARIVSATAGGSESIAVGRLDTRRDFTDVRDVVRAYRSIMTAGRPGHAYNVCSGRDRPISEIVDELMSVIGAELRLEPDPDLQRPSDLPVLCGDNTKLRDHTGWEPTIPFERTIADIVGSIMGNPRAV